MPLGAYLVHMTRGTVEDKLFLDERLKTYSTKMSWTRYIPLREWVTIRRILFLIMMSFLQNHRYIFILLMWECSHIQMRHKPYLY
jgi:hypothetical protein